jgi:putative flippase GtrA
VLWNKERLRMAKFALVGVFNTGLDFAVFIFLVYGLSFTSVWAQVLSYGIGVVNSYWWNGKWTFQSTGRGTWREMLRFVALTAVSFAAATVLLLVLEHGLGWSPALAKAASVIVSIVVNYSGSRYWVFRMESSRKGAE